MYDASFVQVVNRGQQLADERPRSAFSKSAVLLALDVGEQLSTGRVFRHQTVQSRSLWTEYEHGISLIAWKDLYSRLTEAK